MFFKVYHFLSWGQKRKKLTLMSLFSNTILKCIFWYVHFFFDFFFVLTPKSINNSEFGLKKLTLSSFGLKRKKKQFWCLYFQIRCSYVFLMCSCFRWFFFRSDPKIWRHSPIVLKNLSFSFLGSETKKNRLWCCYFCHTVFYFYKCSCFFSYFLYLKQICRCICTFLVACGQVIVIVIGAFSIWV